MHNSDSKTFIFMWNIHVFTGIAADITLLSKLHTHFDTGNASFFLIREYIWNGHTERIVPWAKSPTRFSDRLCNVFTISVNSFTTSHDFCFPLKIEPGHTKISHHTAMISYLFPLTSAHVQKYLDRECLVDVLVESNDGEMDVITFDPLLLPSHCNDRFLPHLFIWAKDNNVLPRSAHGKWFGKQGETAGMDLLHPFYAWLRDYEDVTNTFEWEVFLGFFRLHSRRSYPHIHIKTSKWDDRVAR